LKLDQELAKLLLYAYPDEVEELIEQGADINANNAAGDLACFYTLSEYRIQYIQDYIDLGADLNKISKRGHNSLRYYISTGDSNMEVIEALVEHGVDFNLIYPEAKTILDLLTNGEYYYYNEKYPEVVEYLKEHGAKLSSELDD